MQHETLPDSDDDECECSRSQHELAEIVMRRLDQQNQRIVGLEAQLAYQEGRLDDYLGTIETVTTFLTEAVARLRMRQ